MGALYFGSLGLATAQVYVPDDVLTVRARTIYDEAPLGIRAGSFIVDPGIAEQALYDDNIFRREHGKVGDLQNDVKPALSIQSDWNRNAIFLGAEGDFGTFARHSDLDYTDYGLLASGQYDIAYETYLTAALSRARRHEDLGTLDDPNGNQPIQYTATTEQLGFTRALGRLSLRLLGQNEHVELGAEQDSSNPFLDSQEGQSRNDRHLTARFAFETMPDDDVFLQTMYDETDYTTLANQDQTSTGGDVRAGIDFAKFGNFGGTLFGGYLFRSYGGSSSSDTRDPYAGGQVNWAVSPVTTLTALIDKSFNETTVAGGAGVVQTRHQVSALHSFSTKFNANITLGFDNNRRAGEDALNSKAKQYYGGFGGVYQISDGFGIRMNYAYRKRDSNVANDSYKDNRVLISLLYMR